MPIYLLTGQFETEKETANSHSRGVRNSHRRSGPGTVSHHGDPGPLHRGEMLGAGRFEVERFRLGKPVRLYSPGDRFRSCPRCEDRILGGAAAARSSVGRGDFRVEAEDRVFRRLGLRVRTPFMAGEKPYTPWNMQHNHLSPAAVKAGLGPIGWHTLRHTYRAWLGDNGEPLTVQKELMRHASIQTTLNTYGGGMMDSMREAHGRVVRQAMPR